MAAQQIQDDADPFIETVGGDLQIVTGDELATERILRLLFTEPGDVAHRPKLGAGLQKYRGRAPTPTTISQLRNDAERLLASLSFIDEYSVSVTGESSEFHLTILAVVDGNELVLPEVVIG